MGLNIGAGLVTLDLDWVTFKPFINGTTKSLVVQSDYTTPVRTVFAIDYPIFYQCRIYDSGSEPIGWTADQITANTTANTEYNSTYASVVNRPTGPLTQKPAPFCSVFEAAAMGLFQSGTGQATVHSARTGRAYGYTPTSATSTKTVRGTVYTPQTNNAQRSISSSSASDTAAGTGAQKVQITYYDATGAGPTTEIITLNGTTAVDTVSTTIAFIESMIVTQVGSGGGNVGTVSLFIGLAGGGGAFASIAPGDNQTYWAHHYVAAGKTCYITELFGSATVVAGRIMVNHVSPLSSNTAPQLNPDVTYLHGTTESGPRFYVVPIGVAGPSIIFLNEKPNAVTASTTFAGFHWIEF